MPTIRLLLNYYIFKRFFRIYNLKKVIVGMDLLVKKDLKMDEYMLAHSLIIFGMKKVPGEKIQKILQNDENK